MSTLHNKTHATPNRYPGAFLKATQVWLLIVLAGGLLFAVPAFAQGSDAANAKTGGILGTVVDVNNDPVPDATVVLQAPAGDPLTSVTKDDGTFVFHDVTPEIAYQITVAAQGFSEWTSTASVEPGQDKTLSDVKLRITAVQRTVTVGYSQEEVAQQQLQAEEQQRVLRFIPNMYVTYDPHPEPLTAKMKFHLMYKGLTHPSFSALEAAWAGIQQAANTPDWPQSTKGYGRRFGANLAGGATEGLFSNAILPSLLHQDPRYFYQGSGSKGSRAWHAFLAPFVCKGDNGNSQPNYSQIGGLLISGAISNVYYPSSNAGPGLIFRNFGTNMGIHVALGLAQEFILGKFTSRGKH
jgi:Carboxypeptidase regulatory-like domain